MKRPAKLLCVAFLAAIVAVAGSNTTTAAESDAPAQVLVQVNIPDQVMAAYWTRLPDAYVLRVVLDQPQPATAYKPAASTVGEVQRPSDVNNDEALTRLVPDHTGLPPPNGVADADGATPTRSDRSSFFIGNTIENLRGLNPAFSCRTLTLVDGRRVVDGQPTPAPSARPYYPDQAMPRYKDPRVDVWLLKADGTQIPPATYRCEYARVDPAKPRRHLEVSYEFSLASIDQAVAAAIRIDDRYFIEKLQRRE